MKSNSCKTLSGDELGYLAGLLDGEGWFGITRRKRAWKRTPGRIYYLRPAVTIGMTTLPALEYVASMLDLSIQLEGDTYRVRFSAPVMRWLLPQLIPFLRLKRRQAEILLEFSTDCRYGGRELTPEILLRREGLSAEIRRLNGARSRFVNTPLGILS